MNIIILMINVKHKMLVDVLWPVPLRFSSFYRSHLSVSRMVGLSVEILLQASNLAKDCEPHIFPELIVYLRLFHFGLIISHIKVQVFIKCLYKSDLQIKTDFVQFAESYTIKGVPPTHPSHHSKSNLLAFL